MVKSTGIDHIAVLADSNKEELKGIKKEEVKNECKNEKNETTLRRSLHLPKVTSYNFGEKLVHIATVLPPIIVLVTASLDFMGSTIVYF